MGMYDYVAGIGQVKCFDCNLKSYEIGDKVPCKENGYYKNLIILDEDLEMPEYKRASNCDWLTGSITIIEDSVVKQNVKLKNFKKDNDIIEGFQVIDSRGSVLNVNNMNDLFLFIKERIKVVYEIKSMYVDCEIEGMIEGMNHFEVSEKKFLKEKYMSENFYKKWYKGKSITNLMIL